MAGDFNFIPCSALYNFITKRYFNFFGITRFMISNRRESDLTNNEKPWQVRHITDNWRQKVVVSLI